MKMAQNGGKVVSLTHRPPIPQGNTHGTSVVRARLKEPCPVESAASSTQLKSPPSSMSSEADPRRERRSLLKKASCSDRLEVPEVAYMLMMGCVPSDTAIARPEGMRERLVTTMESRVRIAVPRRNVPML
jgi:hypothetical protein